MAEGTRHKNARRVIADSDMITVNLYRGSIRTIAKRTHLSMDCSLGVCSSKAFLLLGQSSFSGEGGLTNVGTRWTICWRGRGVNGDSRYFRVQDHEERQAHKLPVREGAGRIQALYGPLRRLP